MANATSSEAEFFVGYLPLPRGLRRVAWGVCGLLLALLVGSALLLGRSTTGGGHAHFKGGQVQGLVGMLSVRPTAMLWTLDATVEGGVRGTLLVRQGKFGLGASVAALDGAVVRIAGNVIERDGQRMIELAGPPHAAGDALGSAERARILARSQRVSGEVRLRGEIVDSKCYLGRMRPGDRRTHRACAQLCIAGGIPPLLVVRDAQGHEQAYVLAGRDGGPIGDAILEFVAEPVSVSGELVADGDAQVLRIDPARIARL